MTTEPTTESIEATATASPSMDPAKLSQHEKYCRDAAHYRASGEAHIALAFDHRADDYAREHCLDVPPSASFVAQRP
jgi:hypothetical protein